MKDFKDFMTGIEESEVDEEELSDMMWEFISSLDDTALDSLNEDQQEQYVEIIEVVADGEDDDDNEDGDLYTVESEDIVEAISINAMQELQLKKLFKQIVSTADKKVDLKSWAVDTEFGKPVQTGTSLKLIKVSKKPPKGLGGFDDFEDSGEVFITLTKNGLAVLHAFMKKGWVPKMPIKGISESEELDELLPAKRVRRDIQQKKKASREHRKVKAKRKIEGRRKRKTAKFKRFKKKSKRFSKRGLTSTGKRKRSFINKG